MTKGILSMMMTKLAVAFGLYAPRGVNDAATALALKRVSVAAKAHTRSQSRFTSTVLDDIDAGQSDARVSQAAAEAARVSQVLSESGGRGHHDARADADRIRSIFGDAFKKG